MVIFALFAARSISTFEIPAVKKRFFDAIADLRSSWRRSAYSFRSRTNDRPIP